MTTPDPTIDEEQLRKSAVSESSHAPGGDRTEVLLEATPTVKPTLVKLVLVLGLTGLVVAYLLGSSSQEARSVVPVVGIVGSLVALRYGWVTLLLRRTRYRVTTDALVREYTLFGKHDSRKIPRSELRGTHQSRSRFESLFGVGTIRFLTGGVNQSLGFVEFTAVDEPAAIESILGTEPTPQAAD